MPQLRLFRPASGPVWLDDVLRSIERAIQAATLSNLPEYADDTAAGAGGLQPGQFYRTSTGVVMVKLQD